MTIIFERGDKGWWVATIPEVPGAFSQGKTKEAARANVLDAMRELMEARCGARGDVFPPDSHGED